MHLIIIVLAYINDGYLPVWKWLWVRIYNTCQQIQEHSPETNFKLSVETRWDSNMLTGGRLHPPNIVFCIMKTLNVSFDAEHLVTEMVCI